MVVPVTDRQVAFIKTLIDEREVDDATAQRIPILKQQLRDKTLTKQKASETISWFLRQPKKPGVDTKYKGAYRRTQNAGAAPTMNKLPDPTIKPGVFETSDGIFVVKPNRQGTRMYAKKLVEINADRLNAVGEAVQIEFEYAPGAIYKLTEQDRMPLDRAKKLTILYGRCICCGRQLKAKESVERGIGPVCVKAFA